MNSDTRRPRGSLNPSFRHFGLLCVSAACAVLAACGGDNSNSNNTDYGINFAGAKSLIGQNGFSDFQPNRGGAAGPTTVSSPSGSIATDGTLFYVADTGNNRILGYSAIPASSSAAANFVLGQADFTTTTPATSATRLSKPTKVSLYTDPNDPTIKKLVVADAANNRVLIWNSLPTATGTPPNVVVGQTSFTTGTSGLTASTLTNPTAAMIGNGRLVVADANNNRILIWNTVPTTNGTAADVVLGQPNFTTGTSGYYDNAGLTRLNAPVDLWTDGFQLMVADSVNNRVVYWNQLPSVTDTTANLFIGQTSNTRTTAGTSSTLFSSPQGVGSDGTRLYVSDTGNNRVMVYSSIPVATGTAAGRVIGQGDFTHSAYNDDHNNSTGDDNQDGLTDDPANPTSRTLHTPIGVTALNGTIYVSDRDNQRILFFAQ